MSHIYLCIYILTLKTTLYDIFSALELRLSHEMKSGIVHLWCHVGVQKHPNIGAFQI